MNKFNEKVEEILNEAKKYKVGDYVEYDDEGEIFYGEITNIDKKSNIVTIDTENDDGTTEQIEFGIDWDAMKGKKVSCFNIP